MLLVPFLLFAPAWAAFPCAPCAGCPAAAASPAPAASRAPGQAAVHAFAAPEQRGKIQWFSGTYEELLAEAVRTKRIVFLDFYSRSNAFSKRLEKSTYVDGQVLAELCGLLCFSIDADAKESKALRKRFQVQSAPALVFLDPDGALRDQLTGFLAPEPFLKELQRIKANKGTFSDLRTRILRDANDLDSRWELACKLRAIGDLRGYEEQATEIRERDAEKRSPASRRMNLEVLYTAASYKFDLEPLYQFVTAEKEPALLFDAWWKIWILEHQAARSVGDPERAHMHLLRGFAAARALWPLVPEEQHKSLGNNIAWSFYENRVGATRSDLEFALSVAVKAAAAAPDVPAVVDTLACCLFAVGKRDEAREQVLLCIELDPQNPTWRERLVEFEKPR